MKLSKLVASLVAGIGLTVAAPASAAITGWFDFVDVGMNDVAVGWVCDNFYPSLTAAQGKLFLKSTGPGPSYNVTTQEFSLYDSGHWGDYRPDTTSICGSGFTNSGFSLSGWWWQGAGTTVEVFFRPNGGSDQKLGNTITLNTAPGRNF